MFTDVFEFAMMTADTRKSAGGATKCLFQGLKCAEKSTVDLSIRNMRFGMVCVLPLNTINTIRYRLAQMDMGM